LISQCVDLFSDFRNILENLSDPEAEKIISIIKIFDYFMLVKSIFYLFSFIMVCYVRRIIIRDYESSPLLNVDDSLTEELYNDIIRKSKEPL